ncbi:hypothetical protein MUP79_08680 [Candidatus Bathyarchaeota archaeon]|nr:hypothetical protein [Candidatus Bathyarchaeota archaeon]
MVKQAESGFLKLCEVYLAKYPHLSEKAKLLLKAAFLSGFMAGVEARIFCCVCHKRITSQYVARDLNNNAYCSSTCFAEKQRGERHG